MDIIRFKWFKLIAEFWEFFFFHFHRPLNLQPEVKYRQLTLI